MAFTHNHLTKFYWILLLVFGLFAVSMPDDVWSKVSFFVCWLGLLFVALRAMSLKVMVQGRRLTAKNLFAEKSIDILPESRIYIRRNLQTFNLIIRHHDYRITVVNPNETLKINANVNDADQLFDAVAQLERRHVTSGWLDRFARQGRLQLDGQWLITRTGLEHRGKAYFFDQINGIALKNGQFMLMADGRLWQTAVLSVPVSEIPNLHSFMALLDRVHA